MSVLNFVSCLIVTIALSVGLYIFPVRHSPKGINDKKIKIKHFAFLFYTDKEYNFGYLPDADKEHKSEKEKHYKEVSFKLFIFLVIGYIINFLACVAIIVCFCLNIDITKYVAIGAVIEFVLFVLFSVIMQ